MSPTRSSTIAFVSGVAVTGVALVVALWAVDPGGRADDSFIQVWVFVFAGIVNFALVVIGGVLAWVNRLVAAQVALMAGLGGLLATVAGWVLFLYSFPPLAY